jgi:hypothetical protein
VAHARGGYSREEALEDLRKRFGGFKAANPLPRPGTGVELKIAFAPSDPLDRHRQTAEELIESLFGIPPSDSFLSDDSTLWDFHQEPLNNQSVAWIRDRCGVCPVGRAQRGAIAAIAGQAPRRIAELDRETRESDRQ